jgi:hypothetical protein
VLLLYNQLVAQARACIPQVSDSTSTISVEFHNTVRVFKAAWLCCPVKVQELHPNAPSVQELKLFEFFTWCCDCRTCWRASKLFGHCRWCTNWNRRGESGVTWDGSS